MSLATNKKKNNFWIKFLMLFIIPHGIFWMFILNPDRDNIEVFRFIFIIFSIFYAPFALFKLRENLKGHRKSIDYLFILPFVLYNFVIVFMGLFMISALVQIELMNEPDYISSLLFVPLTFILSGLIIWSAYFKADSENSLMRIKQL